MNSAILGNGPSLELSHQLYKDYDLVLITNRLLWEDLEKLSRQSRLIYICADERFGHSEEWTHTLATFNHEIVLSHRLFQLVANDLIRKDVLSFDRLSHLDITINVLNILPPEKDLLTNVVLDLGIPLALDLHATQIDLFGCTFDYSLSNNNMEPEYFTNYESHGATFDHTVKSAIEWSQQSIKKFSKLTQFLRSYGISLRNLS